MSKFFNDQRTFFRKQVINQTLNASIRHHDSNARGVSVLLVDESDGGVGILHNSNMFKVGDNVIFRIGTFECPCEIKSSIKTDLRVFRVGLEFKLQDLPNGSGTFSSIID